MDNFASTTDDDNDTGPVTGDIFYLSEASPSAENDNEPRMSIKESELNSHKHSTTGGKAVVSSTWVQSALKSTDVANAVSKTCLKWLEQLEQAWKYGPSGRLTATQMLTGYFTSVENPFELCICLAELSHDYRVGKTCTLSFCVIREFEKWLKGCHSARAKMERFLTHECKLHAFCMAVRCHMAYFDVVVKVFRLRHENNEYFLPTINNFLEKQKFKEAAVCAGKLGLQDHFDLKQIILPLILQDKMNVLEIYLYGSPHQQRIAVEFLDHLCGEETDVRDIVRKSDIPNVSLNNLQKKTLSKKAIRLMKLYDIPPECCPNTNRVRSFGALRYILYKKYIQGSLGAESWDELVTSSIEDNVWLQQQLIDQLFHYSDVPEAVKWARYYQLPDESIPLPVADARNVMPLEETSIPSSSTDDSEDWGDSCYSEEHVRSQYYPLSMPLGAVVIVNTIQKLQACLTRITKPGSVIGIDSEWRPAFSTTPTRVALLQLAVRDQIYLLDMTTMREFMTDKDWENLARVIFCDDKILKLGYGLGNDLQMIVKSFPSMHGPLCVLERVTELSVLATQVLHSHENDINEEAMEAMINDNVDDDLNEASPVPSAPQLATFKSEERGLSELVRQTLGRPLSKAEQMSDWERRPLREAQIVYAALDAFVLLEIYDILVADARRKKLKIDLEPTIGTKWFKKRSKDKNREKVRKMIPKVKENMTMAQPSSPKVVRPVATPGEFSVVVDTMLQGLGKQLRSCGVDVRVLENHESHASTINICQEEGRYILTSGAPYEMIRGYVGSEMCFNVPHGTAKNQTRDVLEHFNISVSKDDIFSRCQLCNGNSYLHATSEQMKFLWQRKMDLTYGTSGADTMDTVQSLVDGIDFDTVTILASGRPVLIDVVPQTMLDKVDLFFICATCGKVFWEGSHFTRICEQFSHILDLKPGTGSVYSKAHALTKK